MRKEPRACPDAHSARAPALMPRVLLQYMFDGAKKFNGDMSGWNTSSVTTMLVRAIALAVICIFPGAHLVSPTALIPSAC